MKFSYNSIILVVLMTLHISTVFSQQQANLLESIKSITSNFGNFGKNSSEIDVLTKTALEDSMLYSTLANISNPTPPFVYGKYFVFVYYSPNIEDRLHISFEHEFYTTKHIMKKIETNPVVKVYILSRLHQTQRVNYRLIVNSVWTNDRNNPNFFIDDYGTQISTVIIPKANPLFLPPILKIDDNTIRFYLYLEKSTLPIKDCALNLINIFDFNFDSIFLVGSFTGWDPYLIQMMPANEENTLYYADISIEEGTHYYYYQTGFTNLLDPKNNSYSKRVSSSDYVNMFDIIPVVKETTGAKTLVVSTTNIF